nr:hypothetical protein [Actinomycetota bacterium]
MKRSMGGGSARGPVAHSRQRRTIRFMQGLLIAMAAALLLLAGYSWGRAAGYDQGLAAGDIDAPSAPSTTQTIVLITLGAGSLAGAFLLQRDGVAVVPTPAKLDTLAGRAEQAMIEKAASISAQSEDVDESKKASAPPGD